jgi:hypothetical protein
METYQHSSLWKNAFEPRSDGLDDSRNLLATAYRDFRGRVALLLQHIQSELPSLTLHDITHVDSLWRVASEIAGPQYDLNPAEAFVLGGVFLLHDAAHCCAVFPGGLQQLQETTEWRDAAAQRGFALDTLSEGTEPFQSVLFDTLRVLHPKQARHLPFAKWSSGAGGASYHLLPHDELREAYGQLIGEIAESHWRHPHELEPFAHQVITAPVCLCPAKWAIDKLKVAVLLRTADAAHIDAKRAPRLLMLMNQPQSISREHWTFQARLHQPTCDTTRDELLFTGNPFPQEELAAWWLAFDAACLANKELTSADMLLRDNHRPRLAARSVAGLHSPDSFAKYVPTQGWHPVDTSIKITDIKTLVERFGGEKLYGDKPSVALRELLQNAVDAVHACRSLKGLGSTEGEIEIALEEVSEGYWLHVTDTGIGMSRYVLTDVLLDFGRSLWCSAELRGEWGGLAASGFDAIGQFGIGFFAVFMLGEQVKVVTRRYEPKESEAPQWLLEFSNGTKQRPVLRVPSAAERLTRHGTRVSVLISSEKLQGLCETECYNSPAITFTQACVQLVPAVDVTLYTKNSGEVRQCAIQANDWLTIPPLDLVRMIHPRRFLNDETVDNFGPWSHFSVIKNEKGLPIGRCAVYPFSLFVPRFGIGVSKGLYAGTVEGIAGIIMSKPQSDLARTEAIPDISLSALQEWAEDQKNLLLEQAMLDAKQSAWLAHFGASHSGLIVGGFRGKELSYEQLVTALRKLNEITIDFIQDQFYSKDKISNECLLIVPDIFSIEKWLDHIEDYSNSRKNWSLESAIECALTEAWRNVEWSEDKSKRLMITFKKRRFARRKQVDTNE